MDYYQKYLKYKNKYNILKKQIGGKSPLPINNYAEAYTSEVRDYIHRPSSHVNNFNSMLQVYIKNNSVPFKNNYFVNFIDVYNNYDKIVTYLTDEELVDYKCELAGNKITSVHIEELIKKNKELGKEYKRIIFVTDMFGDVYAIDKTSTYNSQINHTSLSKGKMVSSAGWIVINNDNNIVEISNLTGHYQASDIMVYNFIKILLEHGFDISTINLEINKFEGGELKEPKCYNTRIWFEQNQEELSKISISPVDKINYSSSTNIYNQQIKADLINIESESNFHLLYLIFQTDEEMYEFVSENNLPRIFNFEESENNQIIENNKRYFVENQVDLMEIFGKVFDTKVTIVITSYQKLHDDFSPKTIIRQTRRNKYILNYFMNGSDCEIYTFNKKINQNLYLSQDYILLKIDDNVLLGNIGLDLIKESYKIVYSLGFFWGEFIKILTKNIIELLVFEKNKCKEIISLTKLNKSYEDYKNIYCETPESKNFVISNLFKQYFKSGFVESFTFVQPTDVIQKFSEIGDNKLVNNLIKASEKLSMEYFTSAIVQSTINDLTFDIAPLSIIAFRKKLNINKKEYLVNTLLVDSIKTIQLSYTKRNLKISGRNLSLENLCITQNEVCLDMTNREIKIIHPCVNLGKIIAEILLRTNFYQFQFDEANSIFTCNFKTGKEQNLLLKILIHGIIVPLLGSEPDKKNIEGWDEILRSSVFIELMKLRQGRTSRDQKIIEVIGIEILNKINKLTSDDIYETSYFNKLINEAKYILQI